MKPTRIFISSTWKDLQPEREAVEKALDRMRDTYFVGMEYFGSRPDTPRDVSLAEVDRSDVYIGIFAHRYGSGITEAEYRRSRERDIPCLIYFKDDSVPVLPAYMERDAEKIAKLEALKCELTERHVVSFFKTPDHLATQVATDLHRLLATVPMEYASQAPRPLPEFVGRKEDIQRLKDTLKPGARTTIAGVVGMGGVGKTELAKLVADQIAGCYKDGVLWADCGQQELTTIADLWAAKYGRQLVGEDLPTKAAAWRGLVSNKEALLVFDNLQPSQEVEPLFPPAQSRNTILITTRHAHHPALRGIDLLLQLDQFSPVEAMGLAEHVLGQEGAHAQQAEAHALFELVGYLPLAISIALHTARDQSWTLAELNQELRQAGVMVVLKEPDRERSVRLTFQTAWNNLPSNLRWAFQALAVFNQGPSFNSHAMAAVLEDTEPQARALLNRLVGRSLLTRVGDNRWSLHPLLREFAQECLEKGGREEEPRARHAEYFLDLVRDLGNQLQDEEDTIVWARLDQDISDVRAAMRWAIGKLQAGQPDQSWPKRIQDAALAMGEYWKRRGYPDDWLEWSESGIEAWKSLAPQEADHADLVELWKHKGLALEFKSAYQEAVKTFRTLWDKLGQTLKLTEDQIKSLDELPAPTPEDDPLIAQQVRRSLQLADSYYCDLAFICLHVGMNMLRTSQREDAMTWARRGYWIAAAGDVGLELARANNLLGILHRAAGNLDRAIGHAERGLAILRERALFDPLTEAGILNSLGIGYRAKGDLETAIRYSRRGKELMKQLGDVISQANCSTGLADALREAKQYKEAIAECEEALGIYRRVGHTEGEIAALITMAESYLGQRKGKNALERALEAKDIFDRNIRRQGIFRMGAVVYTILGEAHYEQGQFEQALRAAEQAHEIAEQTGPERYLREASHLMAKVQGALGRESDAQENEALAGEIGE